MPDPDMEAAGAFLARYHRASRQVSGQGQRPTASGSLARLREVTPWETLRTVLGSADALDLYASLFDDLEAGMRDLQHDATERLVIHGDATNDNLIVDGWPPRIVGLIDFGAATLAAWPADLGAALWRSGRAADADVALDPERVARFVRGYHGESPVPRPLARAVPLFIQARGIGLISRRVRRLAAGVPPDAVADVARALARTSWAHDHRRELVAAIDAAVEHGRVDTGNVDRVG